MSHPRQPLDPRITEQRNPRSNAIDLATPRELVELMNAEDLGVAEAASGGLGLSLDVSPDGGLLRQNVPRAARRLVCCRLLARRLRHGKPPA